MFDMDTARWEVFAGFSRCLGFLGRKYCSHGQSDGQQNTTDKAIRPTETIIVSNKVKRSRTLQCVHMNANGRHHCNVAMQLGLLVKFTYRRLIAVVLLAYALITWSTKARLRLRPQHILASLSVNTLQPISTRGVCFPHCGLSGPKARSRSGRSPGRSTSAKFPRRAASSGTFRP